MNTIEYLNSVLGEVGLPGHFEHSKSTPRTYQWVVEGHVRTVVLGKDRIAALLRHGNLTLDRTQHYHPTTGERLERRVTPETRIAHLEARIAELEEKNAAQHRLLIAVDTLFARLNLLELNDPEVVPVLLDLVVILGGEALQIDDDDCEERYDALVNAVTVCRCQDTWTYTIPGDPEPVVTTDFADVEAYALTQGFDLSVDDFGIHFLDKLGACAHRSDAVQEAAGGATRPGRRTLRLVQ
jgi:hypothetical protein